MAFVLARACLLAAAAAAATSCLPLGGCTTPPDAVEERRVEISTPPIAHVVLITLKDPTRAAELVQDCNRLVPGIPSVLAYSCGLPLPSDRANVVGDYSVGFFVAFADEAGYREYTDHPSHLALVDKWRTAWKEVRIFDFVDGVVQAPQSPAADPVAPTEPKAAQPAGQGVGTPPAPSPAAATPSGEAASPNTKPATTPPATKPATNPPAGAQPAGTPPAPAPGPAPAPRTAAHSAQQAAGQATTTLDPNGH